MKLNAGDCRFFGGLSMGYGIGLLSAGGIIPMLISILALMVGLFFAWKLHNLEPQKKDF